MNAVSLSEKFQKIETIEQATWAMLMAVDTYDLPGFGIHFDEQYITVYHRDGYCVRIVNADGSICIFTNMFEGFEGVTKTGFFKLLKVAFMEHLEGEIKYYKNRQRYEEIEEGCGGVRRTDDWEWYQENIDLFRSTLAKIDEL